MLAGLDPWTNMLRLTSAGFGAAIGGADVIVMGAHTDALARHLAFFARRQARNTQLVLMEESHLGRVADPAGGAWFLDKLTDDLARAAWEKFQAIEVVGGLAAALASESTRLASPAPPRSRLPRPRQARVKGIAGVSEFPDLAEKSNT